MPQDVFRRLVEVHQEKTFAVAFRLLRDREATLDVLQESFLELYRHQNSLPPESAGAWLARVARNRALDRIRRRARERSLRPASEAAPSPDGEVAAEEERASVVMALDRLSPQQHAVITGRFYEDLSFAEIGRELGIAEGSVKVHFRRALAALRTILLHSQERAPS